MSHRSFIRAVPTPSAQAAGILAAGILLIVTACAPSPAPTSEGVSSPGVSTGVSPPSTTGSSTAAITGEVERLRALFAQQVPGQGGSDAADDGPWMTAAMCEMQQAGVELDRPQLVVVVDRHPAVQRLRIMLAAPDAPWRSVGGGTVSTGQCGRPGYFLTPTGVFPHTSAIVDYRAQGTPNALGVRGLGIKGMRVWDFGWQSAQPGWGTDQEPREIRLQMHATDPTLLEPRLGRPASKGCIRVSTAMNRFLDLHGVLDADHEQAAVTDARIAGVLLPERTPTTLAGTLLIVFESERK